MIDTSSEVSWLHRFAALVACMSFGLIVAGALVTSNDAGLSVPDWPTAFGSFHLPRMVGGIKFEITHRIIAATVGLLTILLALGLWRSRSPRYVKRLGGIAVLAVVAQGVLGGLGVIFYLPLTISVAHACLAEIFFSITVSLALFTRTDWRWDEPKTADITSPSVRALAVFTTAAVFVQIVLGAAYRHKAIGLTAHVLGGVLVTISALWLLETVFNKYSQVSGLKIPAVLLAEVVVLQVFLGIIAYSMKLNTQEALQPMPGVVVMATTHVAMGALVLASSLFMTFQAFKYVAPRGSEATMVAQARKVTA
jgi:cytochrome c oxidase assembly protein subunit 15